MKQNKQKTNKKTNKKKELNKMIKLSNKQIENIVKRNAKHTALLNAGKLDKGFIGDVNDIACNNPRSKNNDKSLANVPDCFVKIGSKKVKYCKCECKVNEGAYVTETELLNNVEFVCVSLYDVKANETIFNDTDLIKFICNMPRKIVTVTEFLNRFPKHWKTKNRGKTDNFAILYKSGAYRKLFNSLPEFSNYEIVFTDK